LGFSGGGSSQTKPHTHDGLIVNDGGSLNLDNVTQGGLTSGDITYSDGTHLQRLAIGGVGDSLVVNGAGTFPEWAASSDPHNSGMVITYAGTNATIPAGWLLCDGASVATATYPNLFTAIGYAYGGAGANFNLPDMVGVFAKGSATQTATTGGANSLTLTTAQMPTHSHVVTDPGHTHEIYRNQGGSGSYKVMDYYTKNKYEPPYITNSATTGITLADTGGSTSFDNQPAFLEMQYIIKT
jgi:microcystin-dependent protein